jgi:DNA polymerase-3 subunit delta
MYGQDLYSRDMEVNKIKNDLGDPELLSINTSVLDGEKLSFNQLRDACSTYPLLLCPTRLVIVSNLLVRFEPQAGLERKNNNKRSKESSKLQEWQDLKKYIEKEMPQTTILIFTDGKITGKNSLFKSLTPLAQVKTFPQLQRESLRQWIKRRVNRDGGSISPTAIDLLVELIGGDLWTMSNELDKLISFCAEHEITEHEVRQLTNYSRETNIFSLVDSVLEGKTKDSQQLLHRMLQEGAHPSYILSMITRQLRLLIRTKDINQKVSRTQLQNRLGIPSEYALDRTIQQAKKYTINDLVKAYHIILETDIAIKTGRYDDDLAINLLITELSPG